MKEINDSVEAFFALLRAGLWETDGRLLQFGVIDFRGLYRLAEEQSVIGLVAAGLNHVVDTKVPKEELLPFIGATLLMEARNKSMNCFIGDLVKKLRRVGIFSLLVKGQGVALCYEKPHWRACGDVDLYLSENGFNEAKAFFRPHVTSFYPENEYTQHITMHYGPWVVEIHSNQHTGLSFRVDRVLDEIHEELFNGGSVRSCVLGDAEVFLPSGNNDVIIIFTHFLKHFYKGGIGLRQICDWCRLLWIFRDSLDRGLLEERLRKMGLVSEWRAFASYVVRYLGMPVEAMPLFDDAKCWERKADRIQTFIIEVGNFGHNRESGYFRKYPYVIRKACSMGQRMGDLLRHAVVFPLDSFRFFPKLMLEGFRSAMRGE